MQDVFIVSAVRTAVGKAVKGRLAQVHPTEFAGAVLREATARSGAAPEDVQDVVLGCAFPEAAQGWNVARIAVAAAGLPYSVSAMTVNRLCSSGLEAIAVAAAKVQSGLFDVALAGGVESMSMIPLGGFNFAPNPRLTLELPEVYIAMGHCGDNMARDFKISREEMDAWSLRSHQRAIAAIDAGKFKEEIVPFKLQGPNGPEIFDVDEGPRRDSSLEALAKLKPAFAAPDRGFCTAGNASQTSDGAAAVCLMSARAVERFSAKPLARLMSYAVAAGPPQYLGPAQPAAIAEACARAGVKKEDFDLIESNEAFASQCLYVTREVGLDPERINVNGGAIALGHPLGCSGAKLSVQIIHELRRRKQRYGLVTMCIGGGMGAAGVIEAL